jgi:hypothetical protein
MFIEYPVGRETGPVCYTVSEFCQAHRLSRSTIYQMWANGTGPRVIRICTKLLISFEAAAEWRRQREAGITPPEPSIANPVEARRVT